jgi:hypothetical protein
MEAPTDRPDFLHTVLCQVGLPSSATTLKRFERTNGKASLPVESSSLWSGSEWMEQPIPSGTRRRPALIHIRSEAVRTKSRVVDVGNSLRDFMIKLGIQPNVREYKTFRQQMKALSACKMTLGFGADTIDAKPIERFTARNVSDDPKDFYLSSPDMIVPGTIQLTSKFYDSLREHAVPRDPRALVAL